MKYIPAYALLLISISLTSCGQNQANAPKDNIRSEIKNIGPDIMVRNIKKGRNGTILIAGPNNASFGDVFRYDGKAFTNLTSKIGEHIFWDALEDRQGNLWFATYDSGAFLLNDNVLKHFTTRDGLPDNRVMSIYEDKAGIIWFGTGNGLSRYDGKSFQNFKNPDPSRDYNGKNWNNDITTIIEDKTGKLWVGTQGSAFVYDGKTFTTLTHKGEPFLNVWGIIEDSKGNIWLSGFNGFKVSQTGGLWRYDGSNFTKVSQRGAYAIIEDKKGNIWTTGSPNPANSVVQALSRYDAKSLYSDNPAVTEIMSGTTFLGLLEANDGSIWFGSATGVYRYDGNTITDFYNKEVQKKYRIDTKQSAIVWKASTLFGGWEGAVLVGDGCIKGDVDILKGELLVENHHLVGGAVEVNMNTVERKFDTEGPHNKFPEYFDIKKFPVSTFAITKVETWNDGNVKVAGNNIKVTGNLTIEGTTKAVTFPAKMHFKDGMDGTVEVNGTLILDRTDWGAHYRSEKLFGKAGDVPFSDEIKLFMKFVAKK